MFSVKPAGLIALPRPLNYSESFSWIIQVVKFSVTCVNQGEMICVMKFVQLKIERIQLRKAGYPKVERSPDRAARPLIKFFLHNEMDQINTMKINNILFQQYLISTIIKTHKNTVWAEYTDLIFQGRFADFLQKLSLQLLGTPKTFICEEYLQGHEGKKRRKTF